MNRPSQGLTWVGLPRIAQLYVAAIISGGAVAVGLGVSGTRPDPGLFAALLLTSCVTSAWKVNLPIPLASGSTLAVSYAADLTALLLLGPGPAVVVALGGACAQCTVKVKVRYPLYRTAFSMAAVAIAMAATGTVYGWLGGTLAPRQIDGLAKPLLGAIATCFVANTGLVAIAIALSTRQSIWKIWHHDFFWSGTSFIVAGTAGALAAVVIANGYLWEALVLLAPIYLIYRTYLTVVGRLEDQRRHLEDSRRLHDEAVIALAQARRAEQALTAEKERLAVTLRSIADGVVATDADGVIVLFNHAAETMTGWTSDTALGRPLADVFQSVDAETRTRCNDSIGVLTAAAEPLRRCTMLAARDLAERPIEESAAALRDDSGRIVGMVLVFRDISNALRVMEERAKANKLSALGLLAGGIANDFNNILMSIMGNIDLAQRATRADGAAAPALADAERACVLARHLTWQLLTFSRGGIPTRKIVRLPRILTDAVDVALSRTNVQYTTVVDPDLWPVDADESQLGQVVTNLLMNAKEAMPRGGTIAIRAANLVESAPRSEHALHVEAGRYVDISIVDTGIGIPPEDLPKIFDPYFSTKEGSSGLGLATTYSIVKNHGGLVLVDSRPGQGTAISIRLPAAEVEQPVEEAGPRLLPARRKRKPRVLVMDDEPSIRHVTGNMLKYLGYYVEAVENGAIAVERFRQALKTGHPFDVVMLDLMVPRGMGGPETMDRLSRLHPTVRAVLMSGYAQSSVLMEYRDHGFGAVMTKPFTLEELNTTLRAVLTPGSDRVH